MKENVFIIAEAGVNHNGSLERAKEMVGVAAAAGANVIKFQTAKAENVASKFAAKAEYQSKLTGNNESQLEMIKKLILPFEAYSEIIACCKKNNIEFMSSPFDLVSVDFLVDTCKVDTLKIPSGEITNAPFLLKAALKNKSIILSTGMANVGEIELALGILAFGYLNMSEQPCEEAFLKAFNSNKGQEILREKVTLLHCTTEYPASFDTVNLNAMNTLGQTFGLKVGYSDHTEGISVSLAAVARGARVIEKHFTLDKNLPGPDHKASLDPDELGALVREIRNVETALGNGIKLVTPIEEKNKLVVRRSLTASRPIMRGEEFNEENLTMKRPGTGLSPLLYWEYIGKVAQRDYEEDEII